MRPLVRRYREPIFVIFCLVLPLVVFLGRGRKVAEPTWAERALIALTAPIEHALVAVAGGVGDAWSSWVWLRGVREENLALRRVTLRQAAEHQRLGELELENQRLKGLLDFSSQLRPLRLLAAPVVAVGASPHSHTLRISRGTSDGVRRGAAVIAADGIVGTVAQVVGGYADVQLIVSPLSAVPALSQRTRGRSTVKGTGDLEKCRIEYALRTDELQDGDWLVTAGGAGFFPKGLRIGKVINVQKRPTGMFLAAEVVPSVSFDRLDEVLVVLDSGEAEAAPPPAPGAPGGPP